jgi:hypothetical protein
MQTCLIYGHNGLDLDVTLNLRSFYKGLGFKVFFSEKLYDADLLVVLRAADTDIDIKPFHFSLVHVYDYGGWDYDAFVNTIDHAITYIFCTSEVKKERLIQQLDFPKEHVFIALPPVDVNLWCNNIEQVQYEIVHIGNFKPISNDDPIKGLFNEAITHFKSNVWGMGWAIDENFYHGKTGLFSVSSIYSKSKFAFGLMYPFQREVTFSGRFWHAPLNGCSVFSEVGLYTAAIPGVIETDYSIADLEKKLKYDVDRISIQKEAKEFWKSQYQINQSLVEPTFVFLKNKKFNLNNFYLYVSISTKNLLRVAYQKWSFFKIFNK